MNQNAAARFQWRAFVTLFVTLSFLLIATSGLVLYVAPPGRVAHWSLRTLAGPDKEAWQSVHTVFALLFVLAGVFHVYFNWRILWSYLRSKLVAGIRMKRELGLKAGLEDASPRSTIAALASAHGQTPEQVWVALKGEEKPKALPAGGGYGRKTVGEVCAQLEISPEEGLARLRRQGMDATAETPMKDLADRHGRRPHDLLQILAGA